MFERFKRKKTKSRKESIDQEVKGYDTLNKANASYLFKILIIAAVFAIFFWIFNIFLDARKIVETKRKVAESYIPEKEVQIKFREEDLWKKKTEASIDTVANAVKDVDEKVSGLAKEIDSTISGVKDVISEGFKEVNEKIEKNNEKLGQDIKRQVKEAKNESDAVANTKIDVLKQQMTQRLKEIERDSATTVKKSGKSKFEEDVPLPPPPEMRPVSKEDEEEEFEEGIESIPEIAYIDVQVNSLKIQTNSFRTNALLDENNATNDDKIQFKLLTGMVKALTLNGISAPTFSKGESNPQPVLLMAQSNMIMPNDDSANVEGCFLVGAGAGDMSTELVYIRLSSMTCSLTNLEGKRWAIDAKIEGWVMGEHGGNGLQGRLVTRNGQTLAKTMAAGFFSDLSQNLNQNQNYIIPGISDTGSVANSFTSSALGGASSAFDRLAEYYMKMADETFPTIDILGGREVTIFFKGGEIIGTNPYERINVDWYQHFQESGKRGVLND